MPSPSSTNRSGFILPAPSYPSRHRRHHLLHHRFFLLCLSWELLLLMVVMVEETGAQDCPNECSCFGSFVSCYQFTELSLQTLPTSTNTLILNGGQVRSFPPGFSRRFPQLTLLDIQSSQLENVPEGTFSDLKGLDQLALTDCQIGTIQSGAFRNISAVSQILISGSDIGTVRSGAFTGLSDIGEFSLWSTHIKRLDDGAFTGFSDFDSFAFYLNNISQLSRDVFVRMENLGKVDVYMNKFSRARGGAVTPLQAATRDMNMYSNTFPCTCTIARDFNAPLLRPYLVSQKCLQDGQVFRLSEIDVEEICGRTPSSSTSTFSTTPEVVTVTFSTTTPFKVTQIVHIKTSSTQGSGREPNSTSPTPRFPSTQPTTSVSGGGQRSTGKGATDRTTTQPGRGQSHGNSGDTSNSSGAIPRPAVAATVAAIVVHLLTGLRTLSLGLLASA